MSKQCLDLHQMQHLQELGLKLKKDTILVWQETSISDWEIAYNHSAITDNSQTIPAYTLQDVLDALPNRIYDKGAFYLGCYDIMIDEHNICYAKWCGSEIESTYVEIEIKDNLIDAAYELLIWCIENKFVETNNE